jgi:hypothetical protein
MEIAGGKSRKMVGGKENGDGNLKQMQWKI